MMSQYILFLTDYAFRLPQRLIWWNSYNLPEIFKILRTHNYFPIITHYEDPKLFETIQKLDIQYCIPATSFKDDYRKLVNNKLVVLAKQGVKLIPSLELMLCYENKSLQTDLGQIFNLNMPESYPVSTVEELIAVSNILGFPYVVKTNIGYASKGVFAVRNPMDQKKLINDYFKDSAAGTSGIGTILVQKYIKNLEGDWKVIVVDRTAAVLYRKVRENDFRASGSGLFEFAQPETQLLDFAMQTKNKLDTPWVSLDIAKFNNQYYLFEFQATHFGTVTTDRTPVYYEMNDKGYWETVSGSVPMELNMAKGILKYLTNK